MRRVLTAAGAVALVLATAGAPQAQAADGAPKPGPLWRVTQQMYLPPTSGFTDVTVAPTGSGWAVGWQRSGPHGELRPLMYHRAGDKWSEVYLRKILADPLAVVTASSGKNVWAFATRTTVIRWNGRKWIRGSLKGFAAKDAAAIGPSDVWAVDGTATARHWNGRKWAAVHLPARVGAVHAVSARDIWAAGSLGVSAALLHWNGKAWKVVRRVPPPTGGSGAKAAFDDVTVSGKAVWATGGESNQPCGPGAAATCHEPFLLRVEGTAASITVAADGTLGRARRAASDGSGGLWTIEGADDLLTHYTAHGTVDGHVAVPDPADPDGAPWRTYAAALANQPGSRTVWGVGHALDADTSASQGVIMRTG